MSVRSAQSIVEDFTTRDPNTGAASNADSLPTGTLVLNGTDNAASVTVTNKSTGIYKFSVTLPTLAIGDEVQMRIAATVSSIADNAVVWGDTCDLSLDSSGRTALSNAANQVIAREIYGTQGNVIFVAKSGNDSTGDGTTWATAYLTVAKAVSVAVAYDLIMVGPGTFAEGTNALNLPNNVSLSGMGMDATVLTSTTAIATQGCFVKPGNNSVIEDMTIQGDTTQGNFSGPLGFSDEATSPQVTFSNAVGRRLRITGWSDGVILIAVAGANGATLRLFDCEGDTNFDTTNMRQSGAGTANTLELYNCNLRAVLLTGDSTSTPRGLCVTQGKNNLRMFGGSVTVNANGNAGEAAAVFNQSAFGSALTRMELYGVELHSLGSTSYDIKTAIGTIVVSGCSFDPAKVTGAATFDYRYQPSNLSQWLSTSPLALSSQQVQSVVPVSTVVASVSGAVGSVAGNVQGKIIGSGLGVLVGSGVIADSVESLDIDAIVSALAGQTLIVISPVGKGSLEIVNGDSYLLADGRQLDFTKPNGSNWPTDLTGFTITLYAEVTADNPNTVGTNTTLTKVGSVVTPTGDSQKVRVELTSTNTDDLRLGPGNKGWKFSVVASTSGKQCTLVHGAMTVIEHVDGE